MLCLVQSISSNATSGAVVDSQLDPPPTERWCGRGERRPHAGQRVRSRAIRRSRLPPWPPCHGDGLDDYIWMEPLASVSRCPALLRRRSASRDDGLHGVSKVTSPYCLALARRRPRSRCDVGRGRRYLPRSGDQRHSPEEARSYRDGVADEPAPLEFIARVLQQVPFRPITCMRRRRRAVNFESRPARISAGEASEGARSPARALCERARLKTTAPSTRGVFPGEKRVSYTNVCRQVVWPE